MTKRKKDFTVNLLEEVKYPAEGGEVKTGRAVKVFSPNAKQIYDLSVIDSTFNSALMKSMKTFKDFKEDDKKEETKGIDGAGALMILSSNSTPDELSNCYKSLMKLLTTGKPCEIDGVSLGTATIDKMSADDIKIILGEYIANFIAASLLS